MGAKAWEHTTCFVLLRLNLPCTISSHYDWERLCQGRKISLGHRRCSGFRRSMNRSFLGKRSGGCRMVLHLYSLR